MTLKSTKPTHCTHVKVLKLIELRYSATLLLFFIAAANSHANKCLENKGFLFGQNIQD